MMRDDDRPGPLTRESAAWAPKIRRHGWGRHLLSGLRGDVHVLDLGVAAHGVHAKLSAEA
jgi:hypothetical protein